MSTQRGALPTLTEVIEIEADARAPAGLVSLAPESVPLEAQPFVAVTPKPCDAHLRRRCSRRQHPCAQPRMVRVVHVCCGGWGHREVQIYSWGKIAGVADPFGHGICLIQLLGAGYDEVTC